MQLPIDILSDSYKKPRIFLCNADKEKICKLETFDTQGVFKFNGLSEISFEVSRTYNDEITGEIVVNPYYEKIEAFRLIFVEGFGYFELQGPERTSDGIKESKLCTAYSLEYVLSTKYIEDFMVNTGEIGSVEVTYADSHGLSKIQPVVLYNSQAPGLSLLDLALEKAYGWTIGHIDSSLKTMSRQFNIERQSIYDFLVDEVCKKFNCYIVFDTIDNKINLYAESLTSKFIGDGQTKQFTISPPFAAINTVSIDGYKTTKWAYDASSGVVTLDDAPEAGSHIEIVDGSLIKWETDVFVSFDNLAQEMNINYDADSIKTVLSVTYGEDGDIRDVNLGLPYMTDISYYYTVDWMGQDLYDAYTVYSAKVNEKQPKYAENSQKILELNDKIYYEKSRLSLNYSVANSVGPTTVGTYYIKVTGADDTVYYKEVVLPGEYNASETYYSNMTANVTEDKMRSLYGVLKKYFNNENTDNSSGSDNITSWQTDLNGLKSAFAFMETYTIDYLSLQLAKLTNDRVNSSKNSVATTAINNFLSKVWEELGLIPLEQIYLATYEEIKTANVEAGWSNTTNDNYGYYYPVNLYIKSINDAITKRKNTISRYETQRGTLQAANADISNSLLISKNFTPDQLLILNSFLREDELHIDDIVETSQDDISSSFKIKQDAMESGRIELQKLCQPTLQFSMTMANIYAIKEFEPIIDQFQLGKVIKVALRPDYIKQSRLMQVNINFDDLADFSCEFGELTDLRSQSDIHADLLSNAISAGKSVATGANYWTKGADKATSTDLKIQQGLLDATTQIKSIDGTQGVVIDKYGIHLTKVDPNTGEVDPHQVWMVNNMILMSDDGFETSRTGLGEFTVDGNTFYGLIAEAVLSGYIEGSKIVGGTIDIGEPDGVSGKRPFSVYDNGDFSFGGGKINYDVETDNLTLDGVTIVWDEESMPDGLTDYINTQLDSIQIGGRNLLKNSETALTIENESKGYKITDYGVTALANGGNVVISFEAKSSVKTKISTYPRYTQDGKETSDTSKKNEFEVTKEWRKYSFVVDLDQNNWTRWNVRSHSDINGGSSTAVVEVRNAKLELGSVATDWTFAPEDTTDAYQAYTNNVTDALSESLTTAYKEYANSAVGTLDTAVGTYLGWDGKTIIDSKYVISPYIGGGYLNITTSTESGPKVIIDPNNLTSTGYIFQVHNGTEISLGIDSAGNANFAGTITSDKGNIGGWQITSKGLSWSPADTTSDKTFYFFGAGGTENVISIHDKDDNIPFSVSKQGHLTANKGTIAGWEITSSDIKSSDGNSEFYLGSAAYQRDNWIAAKDDDGAVTFRVARDGTLHATGAKITGEITATKITSEGCKLEKDDVSGLQNDLDGKSTTYIVKPTSQIKGDLFVPADSFTEKYNGNNYTFNARKIYRCSGTSTSFDPSKWAEVNYTDDKKADSAYSLAKAASELGDAIVSGLGFQETEITGKYVISPVIAGGHLLIGDKSGVYAEINTSGKLTCSGANIQGTITAHEGEIGGWTIDGNKLYSPWVWTGDATTGSFVKRGTGIGATSGGDDPAFYAGFGSSYANDEYGKNPWGHTKNPTHEKSWKEYTKFYVTNNGFLYAKDAEIEGKITATRGNFSDSVTIGGSLITAGSLRKLYNGASGETGSDTLQIKRIEANGGTIGGWSIGESNLWSNHLDENGLTRTVWLDVDAVRIQYIPAVGGGYYSKGKTWYDIIGEGTGSDIRLKNNVCSIDSVYDEFFDSLKPKTFNYKESAKMGSPNDVHFGFIAQDIIASQEQCGIDDLSIVYKDEYYSIVRQEFIALNTWQIQKAKARITTLEERVAQLEKLLGEKGVI